MKKNVILPHLQALTQGSSDLAKHLSHGSLEEFLLIFRRSNSTLYQKKIRGERFALVLIRARNRILHTPIRDANAKKWATQSIVHPCHAFSPDDINQSLICRLCERSRWVLMWFITPVSDLLFILDLDGGTSGQEDERTEEEQAKNENEPS